MVAYVLPHLEAPLETCSDYLPGILGRRAADHFQVVFNRCNGDFMRSECMLSASVLPDQRFQVMVVAAPHGVYAVCMAR